MIPSTPTTNREIQTRRINAIFTAAFQLYGLTREQFRAYDRSAPTSQARQEVFAGLSLAGIPFHTAGPLLERSRSIAHRACHLVLRDPERLARAQELARGGRRADLEPLLARALSTLAPADVRAIRDYVTVCVLGERNWRVPATHCAWGLYRLRASGYGPTVVSVLRLCGLDDGASVLAAQLARRAA